MKGKIIRGVIPPVLSDALNIIRVYSNFFKYRSLLKGNSELLDIYRHKKSRCFILGSGPSILSEELSVLKDENIIALNNFYVHESFEHIMNGNADKYYLTAPIHPPQTECEWRDWYQDMDKHIPNDTKLIFGLNNNECNTKYIIEKYNIFLNKEKLWFYSGLKSSNIYNINTSDLTKPIVHGNTASVYAIIYALYLGFDEIYLLGMDHNHFLLSEADMRFYKKAIHQSNELDRLFKKASYNKKAFKSMFETFELYEVFNGCSSRIVNLSSTSTIDVFERGSLFEVMQGSERN